MSSRSITLFLGMVLSIAATGMPDPYLIESKVNNDLEAALAKIVTRDHFFIQVSAEVSMKTEKRLVEGETLTNGPEETAEEVDVESMPGFLPEPNIQKPKRTEQNRQVFRLVDSPTLNLIRVHIGLDDAIEDDLTLRMRTLVQTYLSGNYPNKAVVNFTRIPMLKPPEKKEEKPKEKEAEAPKRDVSSEPKKEPWKEYLPWISVAFGGLCMLLLALIMRGGGEKVMAYPLFGAPPPPKRKDKRLDDPATDQDDEAKRVAEERLGKGNVGQPPLPEEDNELTVHDKDLGERYRTKFMEMILARSEFFKQFYQRLEQEKRDEIYVGLRGPAFDSLVESLSLTKPENEPVEPPDIEEKLVAHYKSFREFVRATEWQEKQFFGFLYRLSDEQVMTLANHQDAMGVAAMLRFLKPSQSAFVLESLDPEKRTDVLASVTHLQTAPFADIMGIEQQVREAVAKLPKHFFGSPREDVEYWGSVLNEAVDQDSILNDVEKTQPGIYPQLKKFKFKLDDVATLPAPIVKKVISDVDNEELAMALITCPDKVKAFVLNSVSPQRREFLEEQIASSRGATKQETMEARLTLTKRFREAIV